MTQTPEFVVKVSAKFSDRVFSLEDLDYDMNEEIWSNLSQEEKTKLIKQWELELGEDLDFSHATVQVKIVEKR